MKMLNFLQNRLAFLCKFVKLSDYILFIVLRFVRQDFTYIWTSLLTIKGSKFGTLPGAYGLVARIADLYRGRPVMTLDLDMNGLIPKNLPGL